MRQEHNAVVSATRWSVEHAPTLNAAAASWTETATPHRILYSQCSPEKPILQTQTPSTQHPPMHCGEVSSDAMPSWHVPPPPGSGCTGNAAETRTTLRDKCAKRGRQ
eukprot:2971631-Prymnesium_polylepis.1